MQLGSSQATMAKIACTALSDHLVRRHV
jgi:hypothetical protein